MIALMFGGCFGVVVTCCMVTAKRSDQELGDMMKEKREALQEKAVSRRSAYHGSACYRRAFPDSKGRRCRNTRSFRKR